jgi:hypothetical protein
MSHTPGPWREGKNYGSVVADHPIEGGIMGSDDVEAYGGYLIAESIARCNNPIIAAAPLMLALLKKYVADDPCAPGDPRHIEALELIAAAEASHV